MDGWGGEDEVHPPQPAADGEGGGECGEAEGIEFVFCGGGSGLDHRFAQRDDHEQPESLGDVGGVEGCGAEAFASQERDAEVGQRGDRPDRGPGCRRQQGSHHEERPGEEGADGERGEGGAMRQAPDREQQDESGRPVGAAEPQGGALEGPGQGQPEHQTAEGDPEHAEPPANRVDLVQVGVHRAADPHPEDRDEDDERAADPQPRVIVVHQFRRRGDGEDEHEIEEQLEPGHALHCPPPFGEQPRHVRRR